MVFRNGGFPVGGSNTFPRFCCAGAPFTAPQSGTRFRSSHALPLRFWTDMLRTRSWSAFTEPIFVRRHKYIHIYVLIRMRIQIRHCMCLQIAVLRRVGTFTCEIRTRLWVACISSLLGKGTSSVRGRFLRERESVCPFYLQLRILDRLISCYPLWLTSSPEVRCLGCLRILLRLCIGALTVRQVFSLA